MAQLNCMSCQPGWNAAHPADAAWNGNFGSQQQLNRSNASLNMAANGYMLPHAGMYPPPVFRNHMGHMYPYPAYPAAMPMMNTGKSLVRQYQKLVN